MVPQPSLVVASILYNTKLEEHLRRACKMEYTRMREGDDSEQYQETELPVRSSCPPPNDDREAACAETAANDNNNYNSITPPGTQYEISFMPRNQLATIRLALGLLLVILVLAALATVAGCRHYRLVVATFWAVLLLAFWGLAQLLQHYASTQGHILPPVLRRIVHAVATEYEHFCQDWREQVLLLKNEAEQGTTTTTTSGTVDATAQSAPQTSQKQARSRVFRVLVQPWVPLLSRRRRKRQQQNSKMPMGVQTRSPSDQMGIQGNAG